MNNSGATAILFFSLSARADGARKRWCGGRVEHNHQLARQLIVRTERALSSAPFPIFHFDETNQQGPTFGQRLAHAFQRVFLAGYEQVICVGNDCLQIGEVRWQEVAAMLQQRGAALGPDRRGGAYLIGVSRARFEAESFAALPWQTRQLWCALMSQWPGVGVLTKRGDLNNATDILRARQMVAFAQELWRWFFGNAAFVTVCVHLRIDQRAVLLPNFRGPPWFTESVCAAGDRAA